MLIGRNGAISVRGPLLSLPAEAMVPAEPVTPVAVAAGPVTAAAPVHRAGSTVVSIQDWTVPGPVERGQHAVPGLGQHRQAGEPGHPRIVMESDGAVPGGGCVDDERGRRSSAGRGDTAGGGCGQVGVGGRVGEVGAVRGGSSVLDGERVRLPVHRFDGALGAGVLRPDRDLLVGRDGERGQDRDDDQGDEQLDEGERAAARGPTRLVSGRPDGQDRRAPRRAAGRAGPGTHLRADRSPPCLGRKQVPAAGGARLRRRRRPARARWAS